jgi:hypothetical protein
MSATNPTDDRTARDETPREPASEPPPLVKATARPTPKQSSTTKLDYGGLRIEAGLAGILQRFERKMSDVREGMGMPPLNPSQALAEILRGVDSEEILAQRRKLRRLALGVAAVFLLIGGTIWIQARQVWTRAVPEVETPAPAVPVEQAPPATPTPRFVVTAVVDGAGTPARVHGPDPQRVLAAYCELPVWSGRLRPVGTSTSSSYGAAGDVVLGHFEDPFAQPRRRMLRIFRDPGDGRWFVGDGRAPVVPLPGDESLAVRDFDGGRLPELTLRLVELPG